MTNDDIYPCRGCEDYESPNGCKSNGGCGGIYAKYADELKKALLDDKINRLIVYGDDGEKVEYRRVDRAKGSWIKNEGKGGWHCSECRADNYYAYSWNSDTGKNEFQDKYCPNCGAEMSEGEE